MWEDREKDAMKRLLFSGFCNRPEGAVGRLPYIERRIPVGRKRI